MHKAPFRGLALLCAWHFLASQACASDHEPVVTVRLVHPDAQLGALLQLFEGSRAPHPAAALAAWRRANAGGGLAKSSEAIIALLNPETVRELRVLDGAELTFARDDGQLAWRLTVPHDDGTFAALATALVLTDGASEPPLGEVAVDRLGRPGAPMLARLGPAVVAASSREELARALETGAAPKLADAAARIDSGWLVRLDPQALSRSGSLERRRVAEVLLAAGCKTVEGQVRLEDETLRVSLVGQFSRVAFSSRTIDPAWLGGIPPEHMLAAFALALDPRPEAWDDAFQVADRVEKADPAHAETAPLRTRLNVLALAAGVKPEVDLWPKLVGVSGCVFVDGAGKVSGARVRLHATGAEGAERIATKVLPALARSLRISPKQPPAEKTALGEISGRVLTVARSESTVSIHWGELPADAAGDPARNKLAQEAGAQWGERAPQYVAVAWPWRAQEVVARNPALAQALQSAPPVICWGKRGATAGRSEIRWPGLRDSVRRFLEKLPMAPEVDPQTAAKPPRTSSPLLPGRCQP